MTTLVSSADFVSFCSTRRVYGFAHKLGQGWLVDHADYLPADPEQRRFDEWELGQRKNLFSWDINRNDYDQRSNDRVELPLH